MSNLTIYILLLCPISPTHSLSISSSPPHPLLCSIHFTHTILPSPFLPQVSYKCRSRSCRTVVVSCRFLPFFFVSCVVTIVGAPFLAVSLLCRAVVVSCQVISCRTVVVSLLCWTRRFLPFLCRVVPFRCRFLLCRCHAAPYLTNLNPNP